jgi:hypothetical protein
MVDSIADSARRASAGTWRKPRVRIYDYNQDIGSNYYQPMIKYINDKDVYGPYMDKKPIEMPDRAEIGSNKYSNMRYDDKSNANMDLDHFLVKAYAKQIKELNSSTAKAQYEILRQSRINTRIGPPPPVTMLRNHYTKEVKRLRDSHKNYDVDIFSFL